VVQDTTSLNFTGLLIPIWKREPKSIVWREPQERSSILASPSESHF
jgi:hypothetical protein